MIDKLKEEWQALRSAEPGCRFQERFERKQESRKGAAGRALRILLGIAIFAAGIFFLPAPGPGMLVLVIGAGLIAQEWRGAAKALDWLEVLGRKLLDWAKGIWERSPTLVRALLIVIALAVAAGALYLAWQILFGDG